MGQILGCGAERWTVGDRRQFPGTEVTVAITPGLFWYSGFGLGNYHSIDGSVRWMWTTEANALARTEKAEFRFVDALSGEYRVAVRD